MADKQTLEQELAEVHRKLADLSEHQRQNASLQADDKNLSIDEERAHLLARIRTIESELDHMN